MRRRAGIFAILTAVAGVIAGPPGAASAAVAPAVSASLDHYYQQQLAWQPCGTFECATLVVPRDYTHPDGPQFRLPVIRQAATDPAHRVGTLLYNPGGPAQEDVWTVANGYTQLSANLMARFDLVTWDRRGTAGSDPALQCENGPALDAFFHVDPSPTNLSGISTLISAGRQFADSCRAASAPGLMGDVGSVANARDMDVLRAALGESKVNYIGFSYGSYQGQIYADLFPGRIRTMVLDGMFDASVDSTGLVTQGALAEEREIRAYADGCAALIGSACPAATSAGITALIDKVGVMVRTAPIPVAGSTRTAGPAEFQNALQLMVASPRGYWADFSGALTRAAAGDGSGILQMADDWNLRSPDGGYDPSTAQGTALFCTDRPWPKTAAGYAGLLAVTSILAPHIGGARTELAAPCGTWPATGAAHPVRANGAPPILVVSTTGDPFTPYEWGVSAAANFSSGVLLTWQGHGHTAYGRSNSCVVGSVDHYLIDGVPPAAGTVC